MRYLSQCPNCQTLYRVSFIDINVGTGQLECAKCHHVYDVYSSFVENSDYQLPHVSNYLTEVVLSQSHPPQQFHPLDQDNLSHAEFTYVNNLMHKKVSGSTLDLYTYLNYLETLDPIHSDNLLMEKKLPQQHHAIHPINASTPKPRFKFIKDDKNMEYYYFWGISTFVLFTFLILETLIMKH